MKVLYDYQAFSQRFGGISNYFVQIIRNMPNDVQYEIAVSESNNVHLKDSGLIDIENATQTVDSFITRYNFKGKSWLYNKYSSFFPRMTSLGRNRKRSIDSLKNGQYDLFHPTFFSDYFLPYLNGKPYVLTVHDMIPELFNKDFGKRNEQLVNKAKLVKGAAHVIAVSEKTKEDLISLLNVQDYRISVIYHGAPAYNVNEVAEPIISGRYILYVGNRDGYKNFMPMIKEMVPFLKNHVDIRLVCTGNPFNIVELKTFTDYHIRDQIIHIHPSDSDMEDLYRNALCFIFPSLYEGFGIPVLEAWQAGCPVLLNKKSCFPEIAKDAAIFFCLDEHYSDLREVINKFVRMSEVEMRQLKQKQQNRLKEFSWRKSAEQLADIYRMVI